MTTVITQLTDRTSSYDVVNNIGNSDLNDYNNKNDIECPLVDVSRNYNNENTNNDRNNVLWESIPDSKNSNDDNNTINCGSNIISNDNTNVVSRPFSDMIVAAAVIEKENSNNNLFFGVQSNNIKNIRDLNNSLYQESTSINSNKKKGDDNKNNNGNSDNVLNQLPTSILDSIDSIDSIDSNNITNNHNGDDHMTLNDNNNNNDDNNDTTPEPNRKGTYDWIVSLFFANIFTLMILCAIGFAKVYPILGAVYLYPDITSSWIAVALIFCLVGCGLKINELTQAIRRYQFNIFVQVYDILFISLVIFGVSRALVALQWLDIELANGMVVCGCLPMSVNAVIIMTSTANGDEGAAVFNTALGNFLGVFVSPPLVVLYLQSQEGASVNLVDVLLKLILKVIVPFIIGQLAQNYICSIQQYYCKHKVIFKKIQELLLAFIVYTVFCKTFLNGTKTQIQHIFIVIIVQLVLMILLMNNAWLLLQVLFPNQPKLHVMGIFGCTQKTIALGVPLIQSMYGSSPYLAMFTLPILIWHPMQLVVGSIVSPFLSKYVENETQRLELENNNHTQPNDNPQNNSRQRTRSLFDIIFNSSNSCHPNNNNSHQSNNNSHHSNNISRHSSSRSINDSRHNKNNNNINISNNDTIMDSITTPPTSASDNSGEVENNNLQTSDYATCNAEEVVVRQIEQQQQQQQQS